MFPFSRRSRSLSPRRSLPLAIVPRRSSLGQKPVPVGTKRSFDEAFLDNDSASLDRPSSQEGVMFGRGNTPLMDFQLCPVSARRNWRNVLHKQRFEARIQQHRDATLNDDLGQEVTEALLFHQRATTRGRPVSNSILHSAFCHAY